MNPYLLAGLGFESANVSNGHSYQRFSYFGPDIGGGMDIFFGNNRRWSYGAQVYYHWLQAHEAELIRPRGNIYTIDIPDGVLFLTLNLSHTFRLKIKTKRQ